MYWPTLSLHDALPIDRIGMAVGDHAGAEDVAVEVDQPLGVAMQHAAALVAAIQEVGVFAIMLAEPRIMDFAAVEVLQADRLHGLLDPLADRKSTRLNSSH